MTKHEKPLLTRIRSAILIWPFLSFFLAVAGLGLGTVGCSMPRSSSPTGVEDLVRTLSELPAWRSDRDLTAREKAALIKTAQQLQQIDSATVLAAIDDFSSRCAGTVSKAYYREDSRIYLLLRIMFDLPELAPADTVFSYGGWVGSRKRIAGDTANLSWPISWRGGTFVLLAQYEGYEGLPYQGGREYLYMTARFPFRRLR